MVDYLNEMKRLIDHMNKLERGNYYAREENVKKFSKKSTPKDYGMYLQRKRKR